MCSRMRMFCPPKSNYSKIFIASKTSSSTLKTKDERRSLAKSIQWKMIRLDILKRRSFDLSAVRTYSRKLVAKFQLK